MMHTELANQPAPRTFTPPCSTRPWIYPALIVLFWLLVYVPGMHYPPLLDDADSVHAEAARRMALTGDYVTLYANGIRYLDKAPLPYWLTAATYEVLGATELGTRLPLTLFVLILLLVIWGLGRRVYGDLGGFFAALVLATSVGPYLFTRFFIPDIMVGLWLAAQAWIFLRILEQDRPSRADCWGFAAITALNVLTKGMIGVVFAVGIAGLYLLITADLRRLLRMRLLSSTVVFLAIAAPWHILAELRNPPQGAAKGFLWFYFVNEQFYRYLDKRMPRDYDKVPLLVFYGLILVWLLPWSAFLPQAITEIPGRWWRRARNLNPRERASLLFAVWAFVVIGFFTFSTRQEYYVLPAVPALALLIGGWMAREAEDTRMRRSALASSLVLLMVGIAVFAVTIALAVTAGTSRPGAELADALQQDPSQYALSLGHFFDLTHNAMGFFRPQLIAVGVAFLAGTALHFWLRRRRKVVPAALALAGMMVVVLTCTHQALGKFNPVLGSKPLAIAIQQHYRPGEIIVADGEYTSASTVNFYTGVQLRLISRPVNHMWYGSLFPDAPDIFEDDASFVRLWQGGYRVYLVTGRRDRLQQLGITGHEIAHAGGKYVFSNRPRH